MSHLTQGSNQEKHPNTSLEGAWAPSETQQSGVGARLGVTLLLPSTASANIILAWQQPLPPLTQKLPAAVLCSYPCFTPCPASNTGRVCTGRCCVLGLLAHTALLFIGNSTREESLSHSVKTRGPLYPINLQNEIFEHGKLTFSEKKKSLI